MLRFAFDLANQIKSKTLYVKLTARPRHHAQDTEALEAFKQGGVQPNWEKFAPASRKALR